MALYHRANTIMSLIYLKSQFLQLRVRTMLVESSVLKYMIIYFIMQYFRNNGSKQKAANRLKNKFHMEIYFLYLDRLFTYLVIVIRF